MRVKNIKNQKYFTAVDYSKITELFGIPTTGLREVSLAYAIVKPKKRTAEHYHNFLEIYTIIKGKGIMHINSESENVKEGDSVLIPEKSWHFIENDGNEDLEFYCICVPAFTEKGTVMGK